MSKEAIGIYRAGGGGCNGCDIEVLAALAPRFKLDELGVRVVAHPEEASVLLVTGGGNIKLSSDLKKLYERIQPPRIVVAVGSCAISWEAFAGGYSIAGPVDETIPVNYYICGCPPRPQAIIDAVAKILEAEIKEKEVFWPTPKGYRGKPDLDPEKCTACAACEQMCPTGAIVIDGDGGIRTVKYLLGKCSYCRTCEMVCPFDAVHLTQEHRLIFQNKAETIVSVNVGLFRCTECGSFFVSSGQIEGGLNRIEEKVEEYGEFREDIKRAMELCLNCRNKIANVKGAKRLLTQLTAKTLGSQDD